MYYLEFSSGFTSAVFGNKSNIAEVLNPLILDLKIICKISSDFRSSKKGLINC